MSTHVDAGAWKTGRLNSLDSDLIARRAFWLVHGQQLTSGFLSSSWSPTHTSRRLDTLGVMMAQTWKSSQTSWLWFPNVPCRSLNPPSWPCEGSAQDQHCRRPSNATPCARHPQPSVGRGPRKQLCCNGRPWKYTHDHPWSSMITHDHPWSMRMIHIHPWSPIVVHGAGRFQDVSKSVKEDDTRTWEEATPMQNGSTIEIYIILMLENNSAEMLLWRWKLIWPKAATCGHLRPLAWNSLEWPLAATCGHSLGTVWSGHLRPLAWNSLERPLAATCGHSLGNVWSGHLRPLAWNSLERPLAATRLEQSGAATCGHLLAWNCLERPLAATCGHSLGTVWSSHLRHCLERPLAASCGHLRSQEAASCCHALAWEASCAHLLQRPFAAKRQVATSGCKRLWVAACYMLVDIHGRAGILKKNRFCWKGVFFFKFAGWIGSIS